MLSCGILDCELFLLVLKLPNYYKFIYQMKLKYYNLGSKWRLLI